MGGEEAVTRAVRIFYGKVISDERISWMFVGSDWQKLKEHWERYLRLAFGGPVKLDDNLIRFVHCEINEGEFLDEGQFDAVSEILHTVLGDLNFSQENVDEIMRTINNFKASILGWDDDEETEQDSCDAQKEFK